MPLRSTIPAIRAGIRAAAARGNHRAAQFIANLAYQLAAEDSGDMKRSIQVDTDVGDLKQVVSAGRGLPDPRALLNEYGGKTIEYPAQPFMTPAARAIKPGIEVASELRDLYRSNAL